MSTPKTNHSLPKQFEIQRQKIVEALARDPVFQGLDETTAKFLALHIEALAISAYCDGRNDGIDQLAQALGVKK